MPPVLVYSVDFSNGNLVPSLDTNGWGAMKTGNSGTPASNPESFSDSKGLTLGVFRGASTPAGQDATNTVYVLPGPNVLPVASRLLLRTEFDSPWARPTYAPLAPTNFQTQGSNTTQAGSPWAVALNVKIGSQNDAPTDKRVTVTCQFNKTTGNGVRLNTPGHLQGDMSTPLDSPLDYANYWPPNATNLFSLESAFCGLKASPPPAGNGYCIGSGTMTIGNRRDHRVQSSVAFSGAGTQTWIGALGIVLVTQTGVGQIMIRLRTFSVSIWK
jgi:hypothetical protein